MKFFLRVAILNQYEKANNLFGPYGGSSRFGEWPGHGSLRAARPVFLACIKSCDNERFGNDKYRSQLDSSLNPDSAYVGRCFNGRFCSDSRVFAGDSFVSRSLFVGCARIARICAVQKRHSRSIFDGILGCARYDFCLDASYFRKPRRRRKIYRPHLGIHHSLALAPALADRHRLVAGGEFG